MFFILLALLLFFNPPVYAKYDPLSVPNNRFGIHIVDPNDVGDAAKLVNSSGGDWGYVTLVIQKDDRDRGKWQRVFNELRSLHLIPIVRLATHIEGDSWAKPYKDSEADWAKFLNSLNWPVENRYVVIYNEPNHANEWGRSIDPEGYARVLVEQAKKLHEASEDFFVLPAGLDVSANTDAEQFLRRMVTAEPNMFDHLDGWTSHSYPNPGFSGSVYAVGRGTLRSFLWEQTLLRQLGVTKTLPVFITETGWVHQEGVMTNTGLLSSDQVGANLTLAALSVWHDQRVVAVTPFVLNYQGLPFDHFSWRKLKSTEYYPQYAAYQNVPKVSGRPQQYERYTLDHKLVPDSLVAGSTYRLSALLKNEGQGILSEQDGYAVTFTFNPDPGFTTIIDPLPAMEPGQYGTVTINVETPNKPGGYPYRVEVQHWARPTVVESGTLRLVPPPSISLDLQLGWRRNNNVSNATILIYDTLMLIHKVPGVEFINGKAKLGELRNVVPGNTYRVVVLAPYYLPRQKIIKLEAETTAIRMPRFYPLDFNLDGAATPADFLALIKLPPHFIASLFIGQ